MSTNMRYAVRKSEDASGKKTSFIFVGISSAKKCLFLALHRQVNVTCNEGRKTFFFGLDWESPREDNLATGTKMKRY